MTLATLISFFPALLAFAGVQSAGVQPRVRTMTVEQQVIMRIPVRPLPPPRFDWVEKKGPQCIARSEIRGAALSGPDHVDFLLIDRRRVRARLGENCPTLDFYGGFYLNPEDEQICARRDIIRSRIGGSCEIERFRELVPRLRR